MKLKYLYIISGAFLLYFLQILLIKYNYMVSLIISSIIVYLLELFVLTNFTYLNYIIKLLVYIFLICISYFVKNAFLDIKRIYLITFTFFSLVILNYLYINILIIIRLNKNH